LSIKGVEHNQEIVDKKEGKKKRKYGKLEQLNEASNSYRERSSYNTTPNRSTVTPLAETGVKPLNTREMESSRSRSPSQALLNAFSKTSRVEKSTRSSGKFFLDSERSLGPVVPKPDSKNKKIKAGNNSSRTFKSGVKNQSLSSSIRQLTSRLSGQGFSYKTEDTSMYKKKRRDSSGTDLA
jgi:hypothetical protein